MRIRQEDNESVVGYSNIFESLAHVIKDEVRNREKRKWFIAGLKKEYRSKVEEHFSADYNEATSLAVKIERYNKDNEFDMQRINKTLLEGTNDDIKTDIDDLTKAIETLKISRVEKKPDNDIHEIKEAIKKMARVMKDLTKNDNLPRQEKASKNQTANKFEEHWRKERRPGNENKKQKDPNVRLVDLTNDEWDEDGEYLMVELDNNVKQSLANVRNLGKRRQDDGVGENPNKRGRTRKVLEIKHDEPTPPMQEKKSDDCEEVSAYRKQGTNLKEGKGIGS
ncbi:17277_t:CDS:2 [Cetraspora pellucida]|uniref:17277_t:CDS:1 n=1 Tax=Cetraspora pellucida TaxID=1433469 RepID=A0ACA9KWL5_9GLOM|nr:17277_t:CDS:2 [Cetraspora pellucida]